jgi:hypothetical protein
MEEKGVKMAGRYLFEKKWRHNNPRKRQISSARNYRKGAVHQKNARSHWTIGDEQLIISPNHPCDRILAEKLGRTVQAIQIHRCEMLASQT